MGSNAVAASESMKRLMALPALVLVFAGSAWAQHHNKHDDRVLQEDAQMVWVGFPRSK